MTTNQDTLLYIIVGIIVFALFILLLIGLVYSLTKFSQELRYINSEIKRSSKSERKHWIRKRRRLWLSLLPFMKK